MIDRIENWVVLMFENRSFDNLLGHLPHIPAEDGIRDRDIVLPYPKGTVRVAPTSDFTAPLPDPGEGYGNVNVQMFGKNIPESNGGKSPYPLFPDPMEAPYNVPTDASKPGMAGFAEDYYWNFIWEKEREPTDEEMQQIGAVFTPETAPVINRLAEEYAVFTHWHCEAPTCTFPNRSFYHCATSLGKIDNDNVVSYAWNQEAPNLFDLLTKKGTSWKTYFAKGDVVPDCAINLAGLRHIKMWHEHSAHHEEFFSAAKAGTLPTYSWVEPQMFLGELADYHPPTDIRAAEEFLAKVYNAVRQSPQWDKTALIVLFDEHGGCYDHVPPPAAPIPDDIPGQQDFKFDRFGIRVPAIVISPYTKRGTVITDLFHTTSVLRTLRDQLDLGPALTRRDEAAPSLAVAFNRSEPRQGLDHIEAPPYEPVELTAAEKQAAFGDAPDAGLLRHKKKEAHKEFVSQLGEATMRNVARLTGEDPADIPTTASEARKWLIARVPKILGEHFKAK